MVVGAAVVLALLRIETPATAQVVGRAWGATSLGTSIVWPAGFDPAGKIECARPVYSPSGRYLAFEHAQEGQPMILELATGELHGLYDLTGWDRPNLQCVQFAWLSDERLCLHEFWMAEEDLQHLKQVPDNEYIAYDRAATHYRYRVIDWVARATVLEQAISSQGLSEFHLVGGYSEDLWIVWRRHADPQWHAWWVYDPVSQEFVKPLVPRLRKGDWIPCGPTGPWAVKWLLPYPEPENKWNVPYDVEFVNYETGETRRLSQVAYQIPNGLFITADGRYVIASFKAELRSAPVLFDTLTGQRHELPSSESWAPVALSNARGVVLAYVLNQMPDKTWAEEYVEIPLSQLLPQ